MPKIIENLENRLIEEAKKQIETAGYSAMTIRSVAAACGVGTGTVYNYFPSKDNLVAAYLLADWKRCIAAIEAAASDADSPKPAVRCIYDQLCLFAGRHKELFEDENAAAGYRGSFSRYHSILRSQLAAPIRKFCEDDFASEFIAEAVLTWTMAGKSFDEIFHMVQNCFLTKTN